MVTMTLYAAAAAAKSLQSYRTLCDPIDSSPPGFSVPGILQARTLEWVAISFSNVLEWKVKVKSLSCVGLLATPGDCSLPGSSAHGIFQAKVLEWVAIAFSNNLVYETAKETQMYRTVFWTLWERERVGWFGRMALKHV